jgi:hypothetical protein
METFEQTYTDSPFVPISYGDSAHRGMLPGFTCVWSC